MPPLIRDRPTAGFALDRSSAVPHGLLSGINGLFGVVFGGIGARLRMRARR